MSGADPRRPFWTRGPGRAPAPSHGSAAPSPAPHHSSHGPSRPAKPGEVHLDSLRPDPFACVTLSMMRWHFQTFAVPDSQGWLTALRIATTHFGPRAAGAVCYDLVAFVQVLRATRQSMFRFNPEGCACCRVWLTPEERLLMDLVDALRRGQTGRARAVVQMLCDGAPGDDLIAVAEIYLRRQAPEFTHHGGTMPVQTQGD